MCFLHRLIIQAPDCAVTTAHALIARDLILEPFLEPCLESFRHTQRGLHAGVEVFSIG